MVAVFSFVIGFATVTSTTETGHQLNDVAHGLLNAEQKDKKKLAKRIIRGIQPLFEDALQKESDLAGRPFDRDTPNLEALLDQKLQKQQYAAPTSDGVHKSIEEATSGGAVEGGQVNSMASNNLFTDVVKGDQSTHHAPTPEELSQDHQSARDEAADEAAIAAQLNQDTMQVTAGANGMNVDQVQANNSARAAPPTPPGSDQDLLGPIHNGGVPWYMKEFDPEGTTVYEERWSDLDIVRDVSEELSELDDDELNGLAGSEAMIPDTVSEELQKVVRNKRKRNRGYR